MRGNGSGGASASASAGGSDLGSASASARGKGSGDGRSSQAWWLGQWQRHSPLARCRECAFLPSTPPRSLAGCLSLSTPGHGRSGGDRATEGGGGKRGREGRGLSLVTEKCHRQHEPALIGGQKREQRNAGAANAAVNEWLLCAATARPCSQRRPKHSSMALQRLVNDSRLHKTSKENHPPR